MGTRDGRTWSQITAINCIVDDSALLAGLRDDGTDSLKKWVKEELINVFVPLYTLERLSTMRVNSPAVGNDARKTLEWLDRVTSATENKSVGRVQLQGPDHQYQTWQEVERYLLPDTPFSSDQHINVKFSRLSMDSRDAADFEELDSLTTVANGTPPNGATNTGSTAIPAQVRPLLNFVVWRAHHEDPTLQNNGRYILLTNDLATQKQAQKFGVRAKLVSQLRNVFARDKHLPRKSSEEHDDESTTAESMMPDLSSPEASVKDISQSNVLDPNHFGRSPPQQTRKIGQFGPHDSATQRGQLSTSRGRGNNRNRGAIGNRGQRGERVIRSRGRGSNDSNTLRFSSRAGPAANRSRGNATDERPFRGSFTKPIDPDSYARPARMRGQRGRLWEPQ